MTIEKVIRCDGCGKETRGETDGWWRLEAHGEPAAREQSVVVIDPGDVRARQRRQSPPYHFHDLECLTAFVDAQRQK